MGGVCIAPNAQNVSDLNDGKYRQQANTFHKVSYGKPFRRLTPLQGPEYKVTRRESLGQAAKDHTENLMRSQG